MSGRKTSRWLQLRGVVLAALLAGVQAATAQDAPLAVEPAPAVTPSATPAVLMAIPLPEVPARGEEVRRTLRAVAADVAPDPGVSKIEEELPKKTALLQDGARSSREQLESGPALDLLVDLESAWSTRGQELAAWRKTLTKRATSLEGRLSELETLTAHWALTLERAREAKSPEAVIESIEAVLGELKASQRQLKNRRSTVLTLQNRVGQAELLTSDVIDQIRAERSALRGRLLERDRSPLWKIFSQDGPEETVGVRFRAAFSQDIEALRLYSSTRGLALVGQGVLFAMVLTFSLSLRRRRARWPVGDPRQEFSALISQRPLSMALLVALLATPWLYPGAPTVLTDLVGLTLLVPALRLLPALLGRERGRLLYVLAFFFLVDRLRDVIEGIALIERLVFVAELAAAAGLLVWILRPSRLSQVPAGQAPPPAWLGTGLRVALALLLVALAANAIGYAALSRVLGGGVLNSIYLAVILYGGARMAAMMLAVLLQSGRVQSFRSVGLRAGTLETQGARVAGWVAAGVWVLFTLQIFTIRDDVASFLATLIETPFTAGTVSLALGDVFAFVLTVAAAFLLAGSIRVLLREDVFPRLTLGRGIPNAVSTTIQYAILLLGFFLAIGAAGVDFSRFTILAGAFGVGIGFGLQNVVNNFVSGLILLFERPVQLGDAIEIGPLFGEVRRIGIRSSTIRSWQGAEVIVPNSSLISDSVINWTLSDRQRRIEIRVGVSYSSEPRQVEAVLLQAMRSHSAILPEPPPQVLFLGFGESSLDFEVRGWTSQFETYIRTKSEITFEIHADLRGAGIEIPFPQRDLHVRSSGESAKPAREGAPSEIEREPHE